jgi:hypothetical protein
VYSNPSVLFLNDEISVDVEMDGLTVTKEYLGDSVGPINEMVELWHWKQHKITLEFLVRHISFRYRQ